MNAYRREHRYTSLWSLYEKLFQEFRIVQYYEPFRKRGLGKTLCNRECFKGKKFRNRSLRQVLLHFQGWEMNELDGMLIRFCRFEKRRGA